MRQRLALAYALVLVGGCSFLYNPDNLHKRDAGQDGFSTLAVDAQLDAPMTPPADPQALTIDAVYPSTINEGQGQFGSRPALLLIHGTNIVADATVSITGASTVTVGTTTPAGNHAWIAVEVTAAVETSAATDSGTQPLTITVSQATNTVTRQLAGKLALQNLPQLTTSTLSPDTVSSTLYSKVDISGTSVSVGTNAMNKRLIIRAVSSIRFGNLVATGGNGGNGTGAGAAGAAGPGGCPGGIAGGNGGCGTPGAGGGASGANGGGGGGYGANGTAGAGGGGAAGMQHGDPQIAAYDTANTALENQSSGGGGGNGTGLSNAGGGGGGGGTVELTAGGDITVGTVDVSGGNGGNGTNLVLGSGGGGGGGSGGVLLMRTAHGTITATPLANGGAGGTPIGGATAGGAGSAGRIRCDAPGAIPATNMPVPYRGLAFAATTMTTSTTVKPMITVVGSVGDHFDAYLIDAMGVAHNGEPTGQVIGASGTATFPASLLDGYNQLCVVLEPGVRGSPTAETCIEIAYVPPAVP